MSDTSTRLTEVFASARELPLDKESKFILFSDCHRGVNDWVDDFAPNQNLLFHALMMYNEQGYTFIQVGDGEELWENRNFEDIHGAYSHIYWVMSKYHADKRLHLLWGNHDRQWEDDQNVERDLSKKYYDVREKKDIPLFDGIHVVEGIVLKHADTGKKLFIAHGHQGDWINDQGWKIGRFFVRHFWRHVQFLGVHDPTSPAQNFDKRNKVEAKIVKWAEAHQQPTITGHTHRPTFPDTGQPPYFNTGSCVHPRCITGIEIQNEEISLIKWTIDADAQGDLRIVKEILEGPEKVTAFF